MPAQGSQGANLFGKPHTSTEPPKVAEAGSKKEEEPAKGGLFGSGGGVGLGQKREAQP